MTLAQVRPPGTVPLVWSFPVLTQTGIILRSTAQKKIRFSCNLSARIPHSSSERYGMKKLMIAAIRRVPRRNVRDLMRHNTGQFRFIVRSQNQTGVDVEEPAGESECIDLLGFNDLDRERKDSAEIPQAQIPSGDKMSVRRCRSTSSWYRYLSWPTYRQASSMLIPLRHGSPL